MDDRTTIFGFRARCRGPRRRVAGRGWTAGPLAAILLASCGAAEPDRPSIPEPVLDAKLAQHASVEVSGDAGALPPWCGPVLRSLSAAVDALERAYWEQTSPGGWERWQEAEASSLPLDRKRARLLQRNAGPFDRFQEMEPFDGDAPRSPGGGFYPPFLTLGELERYLAERPVERVALLDPQTVVRRREDRLIAVPFHREFAGPVQDAAAALRRAAAAAEHAGLARHLNGRAVALEADDPRPTPADDLAGSPIVVVLGALDAGDDRLLGRKRAYAAIVGVRDPQATAAAEKLAPDLAVLERGMPFPAFLRRWRKPAGATVVIARDLRRGGGAAHGALDAVSVLAAAPGPWIVLWRNLVAGRMEPVVTPIVERALSEGAAVGLEDCQVAALLRAVGGIMGPSAAEAGIAHSRLLAVVEAAKADAAGLLYLEWLVREGRLPADRAGRVRDAWLADILRTLRVGDATASPAAAVALNWHHERGGVSHDPASGRWKVEPEGIAASAGELTRELVQILAAGDEERARRLVHTYGPLGSHVRATLQILEHVPREVELVVAPPEG